MPDITGRDLDAAVAEEVMGWRVISEKDWLNWHYLVDVKDLVLGGDGLYLVDKVSAGCRTTGKVFSPSSDHNAVALVRAEIERRGLADKFISQMVALIGYSDGTAWGLLNATPEQQCRAALEAVRGKR